ncbi:MAG: DnaB-like helicase C-terminal domain-containing protein [Comamonas sp.]
MANVFQLDDIDFAAYEQETDVQQKVVEASVWVQALIDQIQNPHKRAKAAKLPWRKTHALIEFRPGEVTLWAGANGNGKSLVTGMASLSLCAQGEPVCIASFEMKPTTTLARMARQWSGENPQHPKWAGSAAGIKHMVDLYEQFRDWTTNKLWLYDQQGTVVPSQVVAMCRYAAKVLKVKHVVVDSLMKCVPDEDDYNGQKRFVDELTAIARDHHIHIHLIHHVKKLPSEDQKPNKYDLKGTGAITDLADNVILVWRNKAKERKREENKLTEEMDAKEPDTLLICDKQRNGEWEGSIGLWFEKQSQQFVGVCGAEPLKLYTPDTGE